MPFVVSEEKIFKLIVVKISLIDIFSAKLAKLTLVQISSQLVGKYAYIGSISVFHPNDLFIATTAMLVGCWNHRI